MAVPVIKPWPYSETLADWFWHASLILSILVRWSWPLLIFIGLMIWEYINVKKSNTPPGQVEPVADYLKERNSMSDDTKKPAPKPDETTDDSDKSA